MGEYMEDIVFLSKDRQTQLKGTYWLAQSKYWVFWIHGFADHRLRYDSYAKFLNQQGINFFCFDLRGHGDSSGKRGFILNFEDYLDDVEAAIEQVLKKTNSIIMGGHSMGGLILGRFLESRFKEQKIIIKSAIFSCPFLGLGMPVPIWKRKLAEKLSNVFPGLSLPSGLNPEDISHDEQTVESYRNDPKVFKHATARWFIECLKNQELVFKEIEKISVPVMVMQGSGDRIVDVKKNKEFYELLKVQKEWREYYGLYHEILNETEKDRITVYNDTLKWYQQFF